MRVLKQSTAATVLIGPFLDKTDGVTEESGLATAGTEISKAGGAFAAGPTLGTHDSDGWYPISLTTTHTNTLGDLTVKVHDAATHLPVWAHFTVLTANSYDSMVSGSGVGMRSDVQGWLGTAPATPTTNGVPEVDITHIAGSAVSTSSAQLGVNVVNAGGTAWGSGAITAGVIAADAIGASELAADAVAEIADAVWDEDATAHQTGGTFGQAIGDPGADTNTIFKAVVTDATGATVGVDVAAVLADTGTDGVVVASINANAITAAATAADFGTEIGTAVWATGTRVLTANTNLNDPTAAAIADAVWDEAQADHVSAGSFGETATEIASILVDTGTTLDGAISTVDTVVDAIKVQTDKLTFTVANQVDSNIQSVNDVTITGDGSATPFNV